MARSSAGKSLALAACLACGIASTGCNTLNTSLSMIREDPAPAGDCTPGSDGKLSRAKFEDCSRRFVETAQETEAGKSAYRYTLYFVEFDDQGWDYNFPGDDPERTKSQMRHVIDILRKRLGRIREVEAKAAASAPADPLPHCVGGALNVNLLVYVHGWKHNAKADDENVENFRRILREVAVAECKAVDGGQREVIGLFIGWRAISLRLPEFLLNLTFWDRKGTAEDVAQGSIRELVARIDALADAANDRRKPPNKPVRTLFIGHSFGGHILLTGLGGAIARDLATFDEAVRRKGGPAMDCAAAHDLPLARSGDMVVLINSAIESARFEPVLDLTANWQYPCFSAPLFVSVTSKGDSATGTFFPVGRILSTAFERYTSREQRHADWMALGHNDRYVTHELMTSEEFDALPPDAKRMAVAPVEACRLWEGSDTARAIELEVANHRSFVDQVRLGVWAPPRPRPFCASTVLAPFISKNNPAPGYAPVMNIRVSERIVPDHSDIYDPRFVSFVRELYMDTLVEDWRLRRP